MPSLTIPQSGLSFGTSQHSSSKLDSTMPTAIGLTLTDGAIEEMIRCVQSRKPIDLSLGDHPILTYGNKSLQLHTSTSAFTHDLFRSSSFNPEPSSTNSADMAPLKPNLKKGITKVEDRPNPQWLASLGFKFLTMKKPTKPTPTPTSKATSQSTSIPTTKVTSATAGTDAALAQLKSSMATEVARKAVNTTKYIKDVIPGKGKGGNKSRFLTSTSRLSDTTRSLPSSPNLSGAGSPSLGPTSVPLSQQQAEQAKATRKPVVHLLALSPMTEVELKMKIADASNKDIKQALDKVGDLNQNSRKWELRKNFFRELDVWGYKYETQEDRQRAIDNAVRVYDKLRLGVSEPEWDRLLPKDERGTGKCLSKLQAQIAQGPVTKAPKINVQKAEDSGRDTPGRGDDDEALIGNKSLSKVKGESMTRSVSQPPATKSKKVSEKEAQAKRLFSKNPAKSKPSPTKKEKPAQKGGRVLSSQFVSESDEEDDYMKTVKPAPKPSTKRIREDDGETSDSSIPLSKKVKKNTANHRVSDASQSSCTSNTATTTYSSTSSKAKGNSPHKSSPLASSPPTNAFEVENSSGHTSSSASPARPSMKANRSPIHKRHQKSSSVASSVSSTSSGRSLTQEVMDLARRYRLYYPKYAELHEKVAKLGSSGRRDNEKEQELLDMHQRLVEMKKNIMAGIIEAH